MKYTNEQKEEIAEALEHWNRVCKVADKEYDKPFTQQTNIVINDLFRAKEYLESISGCWVWHPLMDFAETDDLEY